MHEENIIIKTKDGNLDCKVFLNKLDECPFVIFYMDAPAIREELRIMCRRIMKNGYNVILPNLFYRVGKENQYPFNQLHYTNSKQELNKMITTMNNTSNSMIISDTKYIIEYMSSKFSYKKKIGIVGYCMSGRFVVSSAAIYSDRISAIASFYGVDILTDKPDSPHLLIGKIKGELYLAFAEKDRWVPHDTIERLRHAFSNSDNKITFDIYKGTDHGFAFPNRSSYIEKAAEKHWINLINLFDRNLKNQ